MTASAEALSPSPAHGRAPDFFIVGHPKCGTTALFEMLNRRPQVYMPVKEPRYFAPAKAREGAARKPYSLEEYLALFASATPEQLVGEASPQYLISTTAAERIAALSPHARIIAVFREPADFLRSLHLEFVKDHVEPEKDLRKAIELEPQRREGKALPRNPRGDVAGLFYSEHVRYAEHLRRYHAAFPRDQVLSLVYDDFRADNEATVRRVLEFLGVDDSSPIQAADANPTVRLRSRRADELVRSISMGRHPMARPVKRALKLLAPRGVRRRALRATQQRVVYGDPHPLDEGLARELRARFKPEVVAFGEYLDRDLVTLWGYDDVG